ncbi:MAG: hypothetical protein WA397_16920, partial [Roseiarcus sp.]
RVAEAPKLFKQVVSQFRADIEIAKLGKAAWSRTPPPKGTHVSIEDSTHANTILRSRNRRDPSRRH